MDLERTARCLAELGNVARLRIFSLLVRAGHEGLTITEIRQALDTPASTLAHHLRGMVEVGLVRQERQGREVRCRPDFTLIDAAWAHFRTECCQGTAPVAKLPDPRRKTGAPPKPARAANAAKRAD
ncbi:MAG: helix-turn-helix transcriptional regulator [Betaproteobacteria bacterium]|nr:helix-turn-helix transcriptional regulator [Betaproteobacteria bacterium]